MLKRSISADLEKWKNRNHHPLVLSGLRQTGKTFSVQQFGNDNYLNVVVENADGIHALKGGNIILINIKD